MRQLIAGNWKMHGLTAEAAALAQGVAERAGSNSPDLLLCPPFTQIAAVARILAGSRVAVGGQDCHHEAKGAHTGDISAPMLKDLGCSHVILGHSERRQNHGETDELVRLKVEAASRCGLIPIVCVGETLDQRQSGNETEVVGWQLSGSLPKGFGGIVAYEPIWAIGTGRTCGEADVCTMHAFIREELVRQFGWAANTIRILYGGSVKADNAAPLLATANVGGALVGGASLNADEFLAIARAAVG
jgi:triosephosphate isomerase (TIM)